MGTLDPCWAKPLHVSLIVGYVGIGRIPEWMCVVGMDNRTKDSITSDSWENGKAFSVGAGVRFRRTRKRSLVWVLIVSPENVHCFHFWMFTARRLFLPRLAKQVSLIQLCTLNPASLFSCTQYPPPVQHYITNVLSFSWVLQLHREPRPPTFLCVSVLFSFFCCPNHVHP